MKKKISILLMAIALVGCSSGETKPTGETKPAGNEISVVSREDGSGTRSAFVELLKIEEKDSSGKKQDLTTKEAIIANKTDVMLTNVAGDKQAIGYVSLGSLSDKVKALKVDGVEASAENVTNGTYKVARPFNIVTKDQNDLTKDFIEFILSTSGQEIVEKSGYVKVADAKEYTSTNQEGKIVIAGSSSVSPVMEKLVESYKAINLNVTIEIQTSDSTAGVQATQEGNSDIGMVSRELKDNEKDLTGTTIAMDGIAVIVNKENTNSEMTSEQIEQIFKGEITSWSDVANK